MMMKPTTISFLYSASAAKSPLSEGFLSNTYTGYARPLPISADACTFSSLASTKASYGNFMSLDYSSGSNHDSKFVEGSCDVIKLSSTALDAYRAVAQQDPSWYEIFVANVLGEQLVEDIGLPKSISLFSSSSNVNLETAESENEIGDREDESSIDAQRVNSSLGDIFRATKSRSSKMDLTTSSLEPAQYGSSKKTVLMDTGEMVKQNNIKGSQSLSAGSLSTSPPCEIKTSEEAKGTENRDLARATESVAFFIKPPNPDIPDTASIDLIPVRQGKYERVFPAQRTPSESLSESPTLETGILGKDTATCEVSKVDGPDPEISNKSAKSHEETKNSLVVAHGKSEFMIMQKASEDSASKSPTAERNKRVEQASFVVDASKLEGADPAVTYQQKFQDDRVGKEMPDSETQEKSPTGEVQHGKQDHAKKDSLAEELNHRKATAAAAESLPIALLDDNRVSQKQGEVSPAADPVSDEAGFIVYHGWVDEHSVRKISPLSKLRFLGYKKEEVLQLQSDAVEIILSDMITKPKSGIPDSWRVPLGEPLSDVQVMTVSALEGLEVEELEQENEGRQSVNDKKRGQALRRRNSNAHLSSERATSTSTPINPARTNGTEVVVRGAKINQSKIQSLGFSIEAKPERRDPELKRGAGETPLSEMAANERPDARVDHFNKENQADAVVYFDAIENKMRKAPLEALVSLGYSKGEALKLLPAALDAIVAGKIPRPRKGLPINWIDSEKDRGSNAFDAVEVIPSSDANAMVKANRKASRSQKMASEDNGKIRRKLELSEERQRKLEKRKARSRERSAYHADGRKKNVYNGRRRKGGNEKRCRVPDPPQGGWIGWMKYDKFRELLRSEAEMRIRLTNGLGGDLSDAIKEECDLRLGMYEGWLRTMDRGIGQPIIPSRSERYEASNRDEATSSGQVIVSPRNRNDAQKRDRRA